MNSSALGLRSPAAGTGHPVPFIGDHLRPPAVPRSPAASAPLRPAVAGQKPPAVAATSAPPSSRPRTPAASRSSSPSSARPPATNGADLSSSRQTGSGGLAGVMEGSQLDSGSMVLNVWDGFAPERSMVSSPCLSPSAVYTGHALSSEGSEGGNDRGKGILEEKAVAEGGKGSLFPPLNPKQPGGTGYANGVGAYNSRLQLLHPESQQDLKLKFFAPTMVNGLPVALCPENEFEENIKSWKNTITFIDSHFTGYIQQLKLDLDLSPWNSTPAPLHRQSLWDVLRKR